MNHVMFHGRVGADPTKVTFTESDNLAVKFSLAVKDVFSRQENPEPMWIDVDCWNGLGERVLKLIKKGREVISHGRLSGFSGVLRTIMKNVIFDEHVL